MSDLREVVERVGEDVVAVGIKALEESRFPRMTLREIVELLAPLAGTHARDAALEEALAAVRAIDSHWTEEAEEAIEALKSGGRNHG